MQWVLRFLCSFANKTCWYWSELLQPTVATKTTTTATTTKSEEWAHLKTALQLVSFPNMDGR